MAVAGRAGAPFGAGLVGRAVVAVAGAEECSEVSLVAEAGFEEGRAGGCFEDCNVEVSSEVSLVAVAGFEDCSAEECGEVALVAVAGFEEGRAGGSFEDCVAEVSSEVSLVAVAGFEEDSAEASFAGASLACLAGSAGAGRTEDCDEPLAAVTHLADSDMNEPPIFSCQNTRVMRFNHNTAGSQMIQQLNIGHEQLRIARQLVSSSSNSGPPIPNLVILSNTEHYFVEIPAVVRAPGRGKGKGKNNYKGKGRGKAKAKGTGKPNKGS